MCCSQSPSTTGSRQTTCITPEPTTLWVCIPPRKSIAERYPVYLAALDQSMKRAIGHQFNMFIMKWDLAERCCQWLFDKLFELER